MFLVHLSIFCTPRGGVGNIVYFNIQKMSLHQLHIKKSQQYFFKQTKFCLNMFIDIWGGSQSRQKKKLAQNWLLKCALRFQIRSPRHHIAAVSAGSGRRCRLWLRVLEAEKKFLLKNFWHWMCIFKTKLKIYELYFWYFHMINYFQAIQTAVLIRKMCMKCLSII